MHIGVDGNLLCGKKTGMGTVVFNVIRYWKSDENTRITVFLPERLDDYYQSILELNGVATKICGKTNYFKWEQIVLPRNVEQEKIDILWCPYNTAPIRISCPIIITVHDLIYMTLKLKTAPSLYKKAGIIYRRSIVPLAVKKTKKIITISQYAKNEICDRFPKVKNKIEVIYDSADVNSETLDNQKKERFFCEKGICNPFILGFGSLESRKNTMGLIKAYDILPSEIKSKYQLVLFGFRGYENSDAYRYVLKKSIKSIVFLEYISEEEKTTLYRESSVFVFPTFSEGFGIPVLEAFYNKTPVITSNVTSIPEVAGDAAVLVNPSNIEEISTCIKSVLIEEDMRKTMINRGLLQLKKFDWRKTSEQVMNVIKDEAY